MLYAMLTARVVLLLLVTIAFRPLRSLFNRVRAKVSSCSCFPSVALFHCSAQRMDKAGSLHLHMTFAAYFEASRYVISPVFGPTNRAFGSSHL
jgi:hypothetical protein